MHKLPPPARGPVSKGNLIPCFEYSAYASPNKLYYSKAELRPKVEASRLY